VSSTERLLGGPTREWDHLEASLTDLALSSAQVLVKRAQHRGAERFVSLLKHEVNVRLEALQKPVSQQESRLDATESELAQAERSIPLLFMENAADQLRVEVELERRRTAFIKAAAPRGRAELEKALAASRERGAALQGAGVNAGRRIALALLDVLSRELTKLVDDSTDETTEQVLPYARDFLKRVSPSATGTFKELKHSLRGVEAPPLIPALAEPTFRPSKVPDAVLWTEAGAKLQLEELAGYLRRILETSSLLMTTHARERYRERQRGLEDQLRKWMADVTAVAARALERSRETHRAGLPAVQAEIDRLSLLTPTLEAIAALELEPEDFVEVVDAGPPPLPPSRGPGGAVGLPHELAVNVSHVPPPFKGQE
jgi:hypothetical protein